MGTSSRADASADIVAAPVQPVMRVPACQPRVVDRTGTEPRVGGGHGAPEVWKHCARLGVLHDGMRLIVFSTPTPW